LKVIYLRKRVRKALKHTHTVKHLLTWFDMRGSGDIELRTTTSPGDLELGN